MKVVEVNNLSKVNITNYKNGTLFFTNKSIALLKDGEMIPYLTEKDVKKMVKKELKKVAK